MHPLQIVEHLRMRPFVPFRVFLTDGSHYDVRHPEFATVTSREMVIGVHLLEGGVPESSVYVDRCTSRASNRWTARRRTTVEEERVIVG